MDLTESVMAMKAGDAGTVWADGNEFDHFWPNTIPHTPMTADDPKRPNDDHQLLAKFEEFADENVTPPPPPAPTSLENETIDLDEMNQEDEIDHFEKDYYDDHQQQQMIDLTCDEELKDLDEAEEEQLKCMMESPGEKSLRDLVIEIIKKEDDEINRLQLLGKICDPSSPSSSSSSSCPSSPLLTTELDKALRRMLIQRHICLLLHAQQCEKKFQCQVSNCHIVKLLLAHLRTCRNGSSCSTLHCFPSRQIMFHWNKCQNDDCPICTPLRSTLGSPTMSTAGSTSEQTTVSPDSGTDGHDHDDDDRFTFEPKMDHQSPKPPLKGSDSTVTSMDTPGTKRYNLREPRSKPIFYPCDNCGGHLKENRMKSKKRKIEWTTTTPTRSGDHDQDGNGNDDPMEKNVEILTSKKGREEVSNDETTDESDPDTKTWCICHQPENHRRMICCDQCKFWFHSSCVRVNKVKAVKMSKRHVPWLCPLCLSQSMDNKKEEEKEEGVIIKN